MMAFERFDIAVALFPFTDAPVQKPRPVLVISSAVFNSAHSHVIAMMITTAAAGRWPSDHELLDLISAGLSHRSVARFKIFTLPAQLLARRIGHLGVVDREPLQDRLASVLVG